MKHLSRRKFMLAVTAMGAGAVTAQTAPAGKTFRIGLLSHLYPKEQMLILPALAKMGYVEGVNVVYETRYSRGDTASLRKAAEELVDLKVDMIIAPMSYDVKMAMAATSSIPILTILATAVLEQGLIRSYAQPGNNVTGTTWWQPTTAAKAIENLRIVLPKARRLADLYQSDVNGFEYYMAERRKVGNAIGIDVASMEIGDENTLDAALARIKASKADALFTTDQGILEHHRPRILEFARQNSILTMGPRRNTVDAGACLSFHPDYRDVHMRAAIIGDKILRGANPSDIPAEMPMRQSLILNAGALEAIGIQLTPRMRALATEII